MLGYSDICFRHCLISAYYRVGGTGPAVGASFGTGQTSGLLLNKDKTKIIFGANSTNSSNSTNQFIEYKQFKEYKQYKQFKQFKQFKQYKHLTHVNNSSNNTVHSFCLCN